MVSTMSSISAWISGIRDALERDGQRRGAQSGVAEADDGASGHGAPYLYRTVIIAP